MHKIKYVHVLISMSMTLMQRHSGLAEGEKLALKYLDN